MLNAKLNEINNLHAQIDALGSQLNDEREKTRRKYDSKDLEAKALQANYESLKNEKEFLLKEIKQIKTRFENLKSKEKENLTNYEKTLNGLEKENEILNNKCSDLSVALSESEKNCDSTKCQLTKYEQLIDSLNEKVIILKRECKENQLNLKEISQSLEIESDAKAKLDIKCQQLEKNLNSKEQSLVKFENYEKNISNIQVKYKQMQSSLVSK